MEWKCNFLFTKLQSLENYYFNISNGNEAREDQGLANITGVNRAIELELY